MAEPDDIHEVTFLREDGNVSEVVRITTAEIEAFKRDHEIWSLYYDDPYHPGVVITAKRMIAAKPDEMPLDFGCGQGIYRVRKR